MKVKIIWICVKRLLPGCEAAGRSRWTPLKTSSALYCRGGEQADCRSISRFITNKSTVGKVCTGEKIQHAETLREHNVPHLHGDKPSQKHEHDFTTNTHTLIFTQSE